MDTRTNILKTALELYNSQGVNTITSRHIAAKMGISPGNLHYHFRQTDEIIKTLYEHLAADFDVLVSELESIHPVSLDTLRDFAVRSLELAYKYRFIFLHFVEISLRVPAIRKDYYALTQRREKEFFAIFRQLKKEGIFRTDLPESIWEALVTQIFIMGDFWLSNNELTGRLKGSNAIKHYSEIFSGMFYPYLTPAAQARMAE
ncbi:transcriptional regulator, TetR family [Chitinophaga ginsengisegetis]|uniref:Transcriptional regulator, TetR family n=1 Tax=Chitinophaga ginsengisegetis TaxID=393003 RepID=A0A1T5NL40_9BACT|nr:TetR/AcrR family transcriptional regulator [Chitinophaga ginsengisegetis]SKD00789.1 transcriptional regulator, TetR family [Chitinophaga ginsengisegetis]